MGALSVVEGEPIGEFQVELGEVCVEQVFVVAHKCYNVPQMRGRGVAVTILKHQPERLCDVGKTGPIRVQNVSN